MTREIKFRAWDMEDDEMLSWEELLGEWDLKALVDLNGHGVILMQFTGILDLQKKEVYEGDIVTFRCRNCLKEHFAKVVWLQDIASWGLDDGDQKEIAIMQPVLDDEDNIIDMTPLILERMVGNIFESPELLTN